MAARFFSFGCSYTEYFWPTWANILSHTFKQQGIECYNFGEAGVGNSYIFSTMLKVDHHYKFTSDDIIMVVWSSWNREDRWLKKTNNWSNRGNVLNSPDYSDHFTENYWCLEHDIIKNITDIVAAQRLFNISFQGKKPLFEQIPVNKEVLVNKSDPLFAEFINYAGIPSVNTINNDKNNIMQFIDGHPWPLDYLYFVQNAICSSLNITLEPSTTEWVHQIQNKMVTDLKKYTVHTTDTYYNNIVPIWVDNMHDSWDCNENFAKPNTLLNSNQYMLKNSYSIWSNDEILNYLKSHKQLFY